MSESQVNGTQKPKTNEYIPVQSSVIEKVPSGFTVVVTHRPKEFYGRIRKTTFALAEMIHSASILEV